jgi:uncharacterized protein (TIGR02594 family)
MNYPTTTIQQRLNELGFGPLVVDGIKGPKTEAAIVAFKASIGFRKRPYVGPLTWAALTEPRPSSSPSLPWLAEAIRIKGLHEQRDYSTLKRWFDASVAWIDPREIPWCGAFVATVMRRWKPEIDLPENPLGARNWGRFGEPCEPQLGAVLTFWRGSPGGWQGHVGLYWGEDDAAFHVLGGNQSNAVTVTRVSRDRLLQARWPQGIAQTNRRVRLSRAGQPLSTNEA